MADGEKKREHELQKIVAAWMKRKGFTEAKESFEKEAHFTAEESLEDLAARRGMEVEACVKNCILQYGMEDSKAARFEESYIELRDWIYKLCDSLLSELHNILYPLWLSAFLELASKQYTAEAKQILKNHRQDHEPEHTDEIEQLAELIDAANLEANRAIDERRSKNKHVVHLSNQADRSLTEFLHNRRLHTLVRTHAPHSSPSSALTMPYPPRSAS
jgi:hypothetical protein